MKSVNDLLSCYSHYYTYVLELLAKDKMELQYYEFCKLQCIEIAIWPLLYIKEQWCESNISGHVRKFTF